MAVDAEFETTHWTILAAAAGPDRQRVMDYVYRSYSRPLRSYARRFGVAENDVEDVLHDFLLRVFSTGSLERAERGRGRFRSYLLGALRNFLGGERERQMARKRGGGAVILSLDGSGNEPQIDVPAGADDDRIFDEEWAWALVEQAMRTVRREMEHGDGEVMPAALRELVFRDQPDSYGRLAKELGITVPAVKSRIFRMRKRFREAIRREVARTVADSGEVDAELRYVCAVLGARWLD